MVGKKDGMRNGRICRLVRSCLVSFRWRWWRRRSSSRCGGGFGGGWLMKREGGFGLGLSFLSWIAKQIKLFFFFPRATVAIKTKRTKNFYRILFIQQLVFDR